MSTVPPSIIEASKSYKNLPNEIVSFANEKNIKNLPIVKGISNLVDASNNIRNELSGIDNINLRPKLENLGKVLGLKGSDSLKIEHENFKFDVNVTVELDPTKLTDAIVDTGRVLTSTGMPRK